MIHRDVWPLLDQFLDGALAADARWAVAAHLEECPVCRRYVAQQARLRRRLRMQLIAPEPEPELRHRLQAAIASEAAAPAPRTLPRLPAFPVRLAALLGPALAAIWLLVRVTTPVSGVSPEMPANLAAAHALFAQDESLLDVAGGSEAVRAWLRSEVGLAVSIPNLAGYELAGGRLIVLDGKPVAQLVYESAADEDYVSFLRYQDQDRAAASAADDRSPDVQIVTRGTTAVASWMVGGQRAALVAALPEPELRRLAGSVIDAE